MRWGRSCRARSAAVVFRACVALAAAAPLAACNTTGSHPASFAAASGTSVAFESIDGPPPEIFRKLVARLNEEAQTRRLAVVSRESPSTYRVRGYLAARVEGGRTAISWTWDVYDAEQRRAFRITGAQSRPGKHKASEAWTVADDEMLKSIAGSSLDQLAAFLGASGAPAPATPVEAATTADMTADSSSPEAAGIFRMFQAKVDPLADPPGGTAAGAAQAAAIPLPPLRPGHQRIAGNLAISAHSR
jgi:hypothetical protein